MKTPRHFAGVILGASILGALDWFGPDPPPSALLMGAAGYGGWLVGRYMESRRRRPYADTVETRPR